MGGVISTVSDFVVNIFCSCFCVEVNHICSLHKNLVALGRAMENLKALRVDVTRRVMRDEDAGLQRRNVVDVWLTNVEIIVNQFDETHTACTSELEGLSLCEGCSKKLVSRFRYGKDVFSMLEYVEALISSGNFDAVADPPVRDVAEERPRQPIIVGQESILERAWNHLMDDGTQIMGLYGMGGVGKTTLLDQINNRFRDTNDGFDVVIWVVVSKDERNEKIQDEIAEKLGLISSGGESWNKKTEDQKAFSIHNSMKKKRFVLLLDDIWSTVDLTKIGVPFPTSANKCKIVFTTRSMEVCGRMGVDDPIEVKCLELDDAWELFRSKVRQITLESHPDIPQLARKVVEKCRGLPLALKVIGEAMSYRRTIEEWRRAIEDLTKSAAEFSGMEDEILPILKYSYDSLKGELVKSCFRYCSLFPEDFKISKEMLIEYWIGEGFIKEKQGRQEAFDQGHDILSTLVRACLLLEGAKDKSNVKMHDVIREMAIWIASDFGKDKERCIVQSGVGLREIPEIKNQNNVSRMSLMESEIEMISESLDCPDLTTLLLGGNKCLATISGEFFRSMPRLVVLDLSRNKSLSGLPEQISGLVSLRYLDLSWTKIERLPVGLQDLKMLIHLNLEHTSELESLDGIPNLSSLRTLKLRLSKVWLDMSLMKELQRLEHLEFISINISSSLVGKLLVYDPRVGRCIQQVFIEERPEESVRVLVLPAMDNLCKVSIWDCEIWEIKIEKTPWNKSLTSPCFSNLSHVRIGGCDGLKDLTWLLFAPNLVSLFLWQLKQVEEIISKEKTPWNKSLTSPCFSNLTEVLISWCDGLKDLTWLLFAPNLTHLSLWGLKQLEDIISEEKSASVLEKQTCNIIPFQKLEALDLHDLPELKSIYWNALPFQSLKRLCIYGNCQKLRKLPLDSKSVFKVEEFVIQYDEDEWIQGIEWEDEATRHRFLPSYRCTNFFSLFP